MPLIVSHGWPGSVIEQLKIIEPLTNPAEHGGSASDAFDVIYFNEAERGGHFAAREEPQLLSEELRAAFRTLR